MYRGNIYPPPYFCRCPLSQLQDLLSDPTKWKGSEKTLKATGWGWIVKDNCLVPKMTHHQQHPPICCRSSVVNARKTAIRCGVVAGGMDLGELSCAACAKEAPVKSPQTLLLKLSMTAAIECGIYWEMTLFVLFLFIHSRTHTHTYTRTRAVGIFHVRCMVVLRVSNIRSIAAVLPRGD